MSSEKESERKGVSKMLIKIAVALGASESKMRWRFQRFENWRRRAGRRTEQRVEQIRYKNKICPSCRSINTPDDKRCSECGGRLGSRAWQVLDRIGLVMPSMVSASTLLGICFIAVYARIMFAQVGDSAFGIDVFTLKKFGGNVGALALDGEAWRLLSAIVSHGGLMHLGFNLVALYIVGPEVERLYGRFVMPLLFVVTGIGGSLASAYMNNPYVVSIGASGGILGLIGVTAIRGHLAGDRAGLEVRDRMVKWVFYTMILGFAIPGIDNWGHGGGLVAGVAIGYVLAPHSIAKHPGRRIPLSILGVAAVAAAVWLAVAPPAGAMDGVKPPTEENTQRDPVAVLWRPAAEACALAESDPTAAREKLTAVNAQTREPLAGDPVETWCKRIDEIRLTCELDEVNWKLTLEREGVSLQRARDFKRICAAIGTPRDNPPRD